MNRLMEDPQYQPFRVAILAIVAILLGWAVITPAKAQDRLKTFEMHKEITDSFVGCVYRHDALAILKELASRTGTVGKEAFKEGRCREVSDWLITYKELVGSEIGLDGEHITIYRGQVKGKDIYVPMIGWTHQTI